MHYNALISGLLCGALGLFLLMPAPLTRVFLGTLLVVYAFARVYRARAAFIHRIRKWSE